MIQYDTDAGRFKYRVSGVCHDDGRILLLQFDGANYWVLPGGKPELHESASDALRRELREELGLDVEVGRLLWGVEDFFVNENIRYHELGLIFEIVAGHRGGTGDLYAPQSGVESDGRGLRVRWEPSTALSTTSLYPAFLRRSLRELPAETTHIVVRGTEESNLLGPSTVVP